MKKYHWKCSQFATVLLFLTCAYQIEAQVTAGTASPEPAGTDRVHFGDIIDVDVVGGLEFDWRGKLDPEGNLDGLSTFSEPVRGLCRTVDEIAADVERALSRILREPKVVVKIVDRSGRAVVTLDGAVKGPARFRLQRKATLRELIVRSGGFIDSASGDITILRSPNAGCTGPADTGRSDNTSKTILIKITELMKGGGSDPQIFPGDMITVLVAEPIYILGAVENPRPIYSREALTLSRAIAMAGGLSKNADGGKVSIFRREAGETKLIEAELEKIKSGNSVDEILKPFDILEVAARGRQKQKYPPVVVRDERGEKPRVDLPLRIIE